jgi:hypothetical protein
MKVACRCCGTRTSGPTCDGCGATITMGPTCQCCGIKLSMGPTSRDIERVLLRICGACEQDRAPKQEDGLVTA